MCLQCARSITCDESRESDWGLGSPAYGVEVMITYMRDVSYSCRCFLSHTHTHIHNLSLSLSLYLLRRQLLGPCSPYVLDEGVVDPSTDADFCITEEVCMHVSV